MQHDPYAGGDDTSYIPAHLPPWETALLRQFSTTLTRSDALASNVRHAPSYFARAPLRELLTTSQPASFHLGTGDSVLSSLLAAWESAESEILFVTCFWTPSASLAAVSGALRRLSATVTARARAGGGAKVKVHLGFSRLPCLWQLTAHPASQRGLLWPPATWAPELALPGPDELPGLEVTVKSIFVPAFGVAHPKFCVVDRRVAWLPSCNVSWEAWFEGAVELRGPAVATLRRFWEATWGLAPEHAADVVLHKSWLAWLERLVAALTRRLRRDTRRLALSRAPTLTRDLIALPNALPLASATAADIPTLLLPHPHHRGPGTLLAPWRQPDPPPPTPLNAFLLAALDAATRTVELQTPNLTSAPLAAALLRACARGVAVRLVTSRRLMRLEQTVLAGATTTRFLRAHLIAPYRRLLDARGRQRGGGGGRGRGPRRDPLRDAEEGRRPRRDEPEPSPIGRLSVHFWRGPGPLDKVGAAAPADWLENSHLKMTIVDGRVVVLGSGNMDRPSWYVSQELGVAFLDEGVASDIGGFVNRWREGRLEEYYVAPV
jgi:phosphatidylserine/phosphatidylglycerophosphate/cardiolipin synthase-like enzyme